MTKCIGYEINRTSRPVVPGSDFRAWQVDVVPDPGDLQPELLPELVEDLRAGMTQAEAEGNLALVLAYEDRALEVEAQLDGLGLAGLLPAGPAQ